MVEFLLCFAKVNVLFALRAKLDVGCNLGFQVIPLLIALEFECALNVAKGGFNFFHKVVVLYISAFTQSNTVILNSLAIFVHLSLNL